MNVTIECQKCGKGKRIEVTDATFMDEQSVMDAATSDGWMYVKTLAGGKRQSLWRCEEHHMTADEFKGNPDAFGSTTDRSEI